MGHGADHARAAPRPAVTPRHGRGRPGLVDEHQPLWAQPRLSRAPGDPGGGDVGPALLGGMLDFFFASAVARRDAPTSTARTTRSRKSTEYGRAIHGWPPRSSRQFESQQPHVVNPKSIPLNREPL
jgi:hypothetical protein